MLLASPVKNYASRCEQLQADLAAARAAGGPVGLKKSTSNLFRKRDLSGKRRVDVSGFNHVLSVDPARGVAEVEGMTTYEAFVDGVLPSGMLPAVVPQLKTITVGGAVTGLGIESSSFRYGLVHESVESMDILLGDGRIVTCSSQKNPDLFYGFPNSYGTLGYALKLTMRLLPARPFVHLVHERFSDPGPYLDHVRGLCEHGEVDYLDGTIFSGGEMYATSAKFVKTAPRLSDYTYMNIYYQSIRNKREDWMTAKDYIWRWDTDWFWCSKHFYVQNPAIRWMAKPALNSRTYQRIMRLSHSLLRDTGTTESVVQDVDIPIDRAPDFLDFLLKEIPITPIWVCPFRNGDRRWDLSPLQPRGLYINFGFWDMIPTTHERGYFNRKVEEKARELGGTKGLYSASYYDEETFWRIYDRERYSELKEKYDPSGVFPDLYAKCVRSR